MSRQIECNSATVSGRLRKAEQFLLAAEAITEVLDQGDDADVDDAYVTLCVHAGIAAADVICCRRLGVHSQGQDHDTARALLGKIDRRASRQLGALLNLKNKAGYSALPVSGSDRKRAARAVAALVELARRG